MADVLISGTLYSTAPFASQDNGQITGSADGSTITLGGNAWKQAALPITVTPDTVLRLDFTALGRGEIQGIAFETDGEATPGTLFQFFGSEIYGIQDFHDAQLGVTKTYEIPVGQYFTGTFDRLVFVSDDDRKKPKAVTEFSSVELFEPTPPATEVVINGTAYPTAGFPDEDAGSISSPDGGNTITLSGNAWKQASLPITVTADTVLRVDFTAVAEGEIQGIAFETDGMATAGTLFQFFGSQTYGIQDFHDAELGVTKTYEIPVGQYFTGTFDRLVFVSDDDRSTPTAQTTFSSVEIVEAPPPPPPGTERIVFFGDSLGDSDEFWRLSTQILVDPLPDPDYYAQQFSNGEVQTDVIARLLGHQAADPVSGQDYNYAVGGARAVGQLTAGDFIEPTHELRSDLDPALLETRIDLTAQTDRFLADAEAHGWDLSTFTANLLIGLNDLSNWEPDSIWPWRWDDEIEDLVDDIIDSTRANVRKLLDAGVGAVWVGTQPDETFFPIYDELDDLTQFLADGVIDDLNAGLVAMVAGLGDPRAQIVGLELIAEQIEADPLNFGRVDLETAVLLGKGGDYDPPLNPDLPAGFDFATDVNDYGFLDSVHPTEGTHRILGVFQAEAMESFLVEGSGSGESLVGTGRDDLVLAGAGNDDVMLGAGNDVVIGGTGADAIRGDDGSDLVSGGSGDDTLAGGAGHDLLTGGYGNDSVDGGAEADVIVDTAGGDTLLGGEGDDLFLWFDGDLSGALQGPDSIGGGAGSDTLIFYLADTPTHDAALAEYGDGSGTIFDFASLSVTVTGVEAIEFLDLSIDPLELPTPANTELAARMDEWQHWDFA